MPQNGRAGHRVRIQALRWPHHRKWCSMEPLTFAGVYIAGILVFVFVMLFGESELFANTLVSRAHWLITVGACQGIE
jgi:hypothetical protein